MDTRTAPESSARRRSILSPPPAASVPAEVKQFLAWFKSSQDRLDGLVRAAVAHLRFVTIHPFSDGNGRIARAIADMAQLANLGLLKKNPGGGRSTSYDLAWPALT